MLLGSAGPGASRVAWALAKILIEEEVGGKGSSRKKKRDEPLFGSRSQGALVSGRGALLSWHHLHLQIACAVIRGRVDSGLLEWFRWCWAGDVSGGKEEDKEEGCTPTT